MKNKVLLSIVFFLFAQLFVTELKSGPMYLTGLEEEVPVYIPDKRFLNRLIQEGVDTNGDGMISYTEAEAVIELDLSIEDYCLPGPDMITFIKGIEAFINLETLNLDGNMLNSLDLSSAPNLRVLRCKMNMLSKLDLANNPMLKILDCSWNYLEDLDVSGTRYLQKLNCGHNQISTIDLSQNVELTHLNTNSYVTEAQLQCTFSRSAPAGCKALDFLDISKNLQLEYLVCCGKNFEGLDISNNSALKFIILVAMNSSCKVDVWCDPFPPEDVEVFEVYCDSKTNFQCSSEKGKGTVLAIDRRLADQFEIFPNPAHDFITIETAVNELSSVNIATLNGQIVHSEKFTGGSHNMDVSHYEKGMYLITVQSGAMKLTRKIILR